MKSVGWITCVLLAVSTSFTTAGNLDVASYDLAVSLDPGTHRLAGSGTARWRNTTAVATSELWFHLYLNAFASSETTFMKEVARNPGGRRFDVGGQRGWMRMTRMVLADGTDLGPTAVFERPDDDNDDDFTVLKVTLPQPVRPGESVEMEFDFEAQLPELVARTGYAGDFHMVGQWFPKLGVFSGTAGWNCHQFHASSEFFADFGSYSVRLAVPRGWVVGATGELVSREPVATRDELEFIARDVHDFAWTAAPPKLMTAVEADFDPGRDVPLVWLERAMERLDLGAAELELPPMKIRLLVPRTQEELVPRMLRAIRLGLAWHGLHFGAYPYAQLTVVSPPPKASAAGGMEYPTLITTGAGRFAAVPPFSWSAGIEVVTVHEIGHQYFQGMLASNEFEQAWLDEGLTSWAEYRCLDDIVGDGLAPDIRWHSTWAASRLWASFIDLPVTVDRPTWTQRLFVDNVFASYTKTALAVRTLEGLFGEDRLQRAIRSYVDGHRFDHPTGRDFQRALELALDEDLEWFFAAVIRGDKTPDWGVLAVRQRRAEAPDGMEWVGDEWRRRDGGEAPDDDDGPWRVDIELGRFGDLVGPVDVELRWADGSVERRRWESRERWVRWSEERERRLDAVLVDPDGAWVLETNRGDNYWRSEPSDAGPGWWLGGLLSFAGSLTVPWG